MKGFKYRINSNNENISSNVPKFDNKLNKGTKITIQDGKVRAPLVRLFI